MGIKIDLKLKKEWLYAEGGKNSFAVSKFVTECKRIFGDDNTEVEKKAFDECCLLISTELDEDGLNKKLGTLLKEKLKISSEDVYQLVINGKASMPSEGSTDKKEDASEVNVSENNSKDEESDTLVSGDGMSEKKDTGVLDKINSLVGADDFKKLCNDIYNRSELVKKNESQDVFFSHSYLFSINQGEGYSHSLSLLAELLFETSLFKGGIPKEVKEVELPDHNADHLPERMEILMNRLEGYLKRGGIVSYDISGWVGHTSSGEFKKLLMFIFKKSKGCVNVFKIPVVSETRLNETIADISDIISVHSVYYKPFDYDEMQDVAQRLLDNNNITVEKSVWNIFNKKIDEERHDGSFYGVHTIQKIVNEMIHHMEVYNVENKVDMNTITPEKIKNILTFENTDEISGEEELDTLIGMGAVKDQVRGMIRQIELAHASDKIKTPVMHMCFTGNPGTGKTTVARIIGKILREKGILRIGKFYEYRGRDLCGRYVGETAVKTTNICKDAYGSVLFIDEAYSLFRGDDNTRDYGVEALDTIIAEMENHADDLIVIFAGYPDDIRIMMTGNSGMKSRIPYIIDFPNYSREELAEIFFRYAEDVRYDDKLEGRVKQYFDGLSDELMERKDFGNARFVRNIFERTRGKAMIRTADSGEKEISITVEDFEVAVKEIEEAEKSTGQKKPIGF